MGSGAKPAPRVLLVDDDPVVAYCLEQELALLGAVVLVAGDGQAALRLLTDEILSLDLVVTDLEMPVLDGLELVKRLRTTCGETDLPIVAIADGPTNEVVAGLKALGVALVSKSPGPNAVAEEARRVLEYAGRLPPRREPRFDDEAWVARPLSREPNSIGRLKP